MNRSNIDTTRRVAIAVGLIAVALLGAGLYLQHVKDMLPCPLCVIQRYAFAAVAIACLSTVFLSRKASRIATGIGALAAIAGASVAGWHLWIKANPATSCGIDPLETSLNTIPTAKLMPYLFQADGLCSTDYPPVFGFSIPLWALIWFAVFTLALARTALQSRK